MTNKFNCPVGLPIPPTYHAANRSPSLFRLKNGRGQAKKKKSLCPTFPHAGSNLSRPRHPRHRPPTAHQCHPIRHARSPTCKKISANYLNLTKQKVVIWAHYDVHWNLPWADDNASWIAWLLEIARLINNKDLDLDYWIEFVAYILEEMPYFRTENMWSAIHSKSLKDANTKVKLMISLEMIGYFTDSENSQKYPLKQMKLYYPDKWNFIAVVWKFWQSIITKKVKNNIQQVSDIPAYSLNWFSFIRWIDNSDHRNYWNDWYKAVMITDTSFYRNPNYHKAWDTINTIDFDKMSEVVKWVYWAIINM